jgi:RNA polymerase sigma-70 factor, ECF subfamily
VARADQCRILGEVDEARAHYKRPLALVRQEPVRRFLVRRLQELNG